jgi:hypothetical protein
MIYIRLGGRKSREKKWVKEVYITVVPSDVSTSQDAETHYKGNSPEGAAQGLVAR